MHCSWCSIIVLFIILNLLFTYFVLCHNASYTFNVGCNLEILPIFGIFEFKFEIMSKNTSISLGNYFDQFVSSQVSAGRYKNVSEVIRAGLRLLENEESKVIALRNAIQQGLNSPIVEDFDFDENLKKLKSERRKNG